MLRALIVDDNVSFRQSLHRVLTRRFPFMQIAEAASGEDALAQAAAVPPNFVFMDIKLPGKNGLDTTRVLKSTLAHAMVCVITSYDVPEYREAAKDCGADHFLVKGEANEAQIATVMDSLLSSRMKSLVVEDSDSFRHALEEMLTRQWPAMLVAKSEGRHGLGTVAALKPDLVLLDLRQPQSDVVDLARTVRIENPDSDVVIVASDDRPEVRAAAEVADAICLIAETGTLADQIIATVDACRSRREARLH